MTKLIYFVEILQQQDKSFKSFLLSYTSFANNNRFNTLTIIIELIEKQISFKIASS